MTQGYNDGDFLDIGEAGMKWDNDYPQRRNMPNAQSNETASDRADEVEEEKVNSVEEKVKKVFETWQIDYRGKFRALFDRVVAEAEANPDFIDDEKADKEITKLIAVNASREVVELMGAQGMVDNQETKTIYANLVAYYWKGQILDDEVALFNQVNNEEMTWSRLNRLMTQTMTVEGKVIKKWDESWVEIMKKFFENFDQTKFKIIGEELSFIAQAGLALKDEGDQVMTTTDVGKNEEQKGSVREAEPVALGAGEGEDAGVRADLGAN